MEIARIKTQNLIHNTYKPLPDWEIDYTTDFTTKFRPLSNTEEYDPYYIDPDYNRDPYWEDELYDQQHLQFHHNLLGQNDNLGQDEPISDIALTHALIHLWEPNETKSNDQLQPKGGKALKTQDEASLLDENIFVNVLISSEGHPPYVSLSTNLGLKQTKNALLPYGFWRAYNRWTC